MFTEQVLGREKVTHVKLVEKASSVWRLELFRWLMAWGDVGDECSSSEEHLDINQSPSWNSVWLSNYSCFVTCV